MTTQTTQTNQTHRTVHLRAGGTSLVLDLLPDRLPVVRHWGADLGEVTGGDLADAAAASSSALAEDTVWSCNDLPLLPLAHLGWTGRPGALLHRTDGTAFSPHPTSVTHALSQAEGPAGTTQVVTSQALDPAHFLTLGTEIRLEPMGLVRLRAWVRDDRPATQAAATPHGTGNAAPPHGAVADAAALPGTQAPAPLAPLAVDELTPVLPLPQAADEVLDMAGHHIAERSLQRHTLTVGTYLRESWEGRPGHDATTWLAAGRHGFGFRTGTVHGVHLAWSGSTRSLVSLTPNGARLIGAGELLQPGEVILDGRQGTEEDPSGRTYTSPWAVFSWGEGLDALSHRTHAWLRSLPSHPTRPRPVLLNTWEAVYFNHDLDTLKALADAAAEVGIDRFVLDDGWFGSRRDDTSGLGDWQVSRQAWPDGLRPLADHVHSLGMELGLWFEPEMVNLDSDLARAHPDWVLGDEAGGAVEHRHQRVLDLTAPGAWDYLLESVSRLVEELDLAYLKWDHNSPVLAAGHATAAPVSGRAGGAAVHDQTLALYRLLDTLHERFADLEIESCAGGGGRIDLGILERTQRVWASDSIDAHDRLDIQRGTVMLLPPELIGTHVGAGRAHTTLRDLDLDFRAGTALWGHMGVEWDLTQASPADRERLAGVIALHKRLRPLLHSGLTVHADLADDAHLRVEGVVSTDRCEGLFTIACLGTQVTWPGAPLPLPGLDPARLYHVRLAAPAYPGLRRPAGWMGPEGVRLPGSYLTGTGLTPPVLHPDHLVLVAVSALG